MTFELKSKKKSVMNVLQEKFQNEGPASSWVMNRFGLSEEGPWGWSVMEAALGNGTISRVGDWHTRWGPSMENSKHLWQWLCPPNWHFQNLWYVKTWCQLLCWIQRLLYPKGLSQFYTNEILGICVANKMEESSHVFHNPKMCTRHYFWQLLSLLKIKQMDNKNTKIPIKKCSMRRN